MIERQAIPFSRGSVFEAVLCARQATEMRQNSPCIPFRRAYSLPPPERRACGCSLRLRNEKSINNLTFNLRCHPQRLVLGNGAFAGVRPDQVSRYENTIICSPW